jgi:hypothetical protein
MAAQEVPHMDDSVIEAGRPLATKYFVPLATILGVVEQESAGVIFAEVDGRQEPVVRHEGHYLYKRLKDDQLTRAKNAGLVSSKAGGVKNPAQQADRWHKLITPAMNINRAAEIESVSWGVGQVMGAHWKSLGFLDAESFLHYVRSGVREQMDVMLRFCDENGLLDEMRRGDFVGFTKVYNGPGAVGSYSTAMAKKVKAWEKRLGTPPRMVTLKRGSKGEAVKELQVELNAVGRVLDVDGDYGPATEKAVESFQKAAGLRVDGIAGPATRAALAAAKG